MIIIDDRKCIGCGACVKDCIVHNLTLESSKIKAGSECLLCGHCVAVCPVRAVSLDDYEMDEVVEYNHDTFQIEPKSLLNAIKFRRSVRDFQAKSVEDEKIQKILEAGRYTETGGNSQGVRFYVLQEQLEPFKKMVWESFYELAKEAVANNNLYGETFLEYCENYHKDSQHDRLFFNAPIAILLACDYPLDAGLASANMELMAVAQDLGVLFDGYVVHAIARSEQLKNWLSLGGKQVVSCMLLGYSNVQYHRTVPRRAADIVWK